MAAITACAAELPAPPPKPTPGPAADHPALERILPDDVRSVLAGANRMEVFGLDAWAFDRIGMGELLGRIPASVKTVPEGYRWALGRGIGVAGKIVLDREHIGFVLDRVYGGLVDRPLSLRCGPEQWMYAVRAVRDRETVVFLLDPGRGSALLVHGRTIRFLKLRDRGGELRNLFDAVLARAGVALPRGCA